MKLFHLSEFSEQLYVKFLIEQLEKKSFYANISLILSLKYTFW